MAPRDYIRRLVIAVALGSLLNACLAKDGEGLDVQKAEQQSVCSQFPLPRDANDLGLMKTLYSRWLQAQTWWSKFVSNPGALTSLLFQSITSRFGEGRSGGRTHAGIDLAAPCGTPVLAPFAGMITQTSGDTNNPCGLTWSLQSSQDPDLRARVCHLDPSCELPEPGLEVGVGQPVGCVGTTGTTSDGCHLHLEIYKPTLKDPEDVYGKDLAQMAKSCPSTPQVETMLVGLDCVGTFDRPRCTIQAKPNVIGVDKVSAIVRWSSDPSPSSNRPAGSINESLDGITLAKEADGNWQSTQLSPPVPLPVGGSVKITVTGRRNNSPVESGYLYAWFYPPLNKPPAVKCKSDEPLIFYLRNIGETSTTSSQASEPGKKTVELGYANVCDLVRVDGSLERAGRYVLEMSPLALQGSGAHLAGPGDQSLLSPAAWAHATMPTEEVVTIVATLTSKLGSDGRSTTEVARSNIRVRLQP